MGRTIWGNNRKNTREYLLMIMLTSILWCLVLEYRHIFPFGNEMMDIGDMGASVVPMYTFWWDVLHGNSSWYFDWHTGLGNEMITEVWHFGLLSPVNFFFCFIKREWIEVSLSFFLLIKLIIISLSTVYVFRRWFSSVSWKTRCAFSLLYVFSAFTMQYYYFPAWLDIVGIFPVLMYFYFRLIEHGEARGYVIVLSLTGIMSFQHIYMVVIFLVFITGYLLLFVRNKVKNNLYLLLISSFCAGLLAAFIWLPGILHAMEAGRIEENKNIITIWNSIYVLFPDKWLKVINMGIPFSFLIMMFLKKIERKASAFFAYIIFILGSPVILESTNLLCHGGSYNGYTMRFAYMLTFWGIVGGIYGYDKIVQKNLERQVAFKSGMGIKKCLLFALFVLICILQCVWLSKKIGVFEIAFLLVLTIAFNIGMWKVVKYHYERYMLGVVFIQSLILSLCMIKTSWNLEDSYIGACNSVYKVETDPFARIKSLDVDLSQNYPILMGKYALSNYLAFTSEDQLELSYDMGHAKVGIRLSDYGGTLFTDALMGVKEVYSQAMPNVDLYDIIQNRFYKSRYSYDTGIILQQLFPTVSDEENPFRYQNQVSKAVTGIELFDVRVSREKAFSVDIKGKSVVYLYAENGNYFPKVTVIYNNGNSTNNIILHESGWLNGILDLGTYERGNIEVDIHADHDIGTIYIALLSLELFNDNKPVYAKNFEYACDNNSMHISLFAEENDTYLFLPLHFNDGWSGERNGDSLFIERVFNHFMAIPLEKGKNDIILTYRPRGFIFGIIFSMVGCLLFIFGIYRKKLGWMCSLNGILFYMSTFVYIFLVAVFYVIPMIVFIQFCL